MPPSKQPSGQPSATRLRVRRVYDPPEPADGVRVLADRLWPRGLAKEAAAVDEWPKELTPTGELRTWYHAHPEQHEEFARRFRAELAEADREGAVRRLRALARERTVTLLTAVKDPGSSHVPVLRAFLEQGA